MNFNKLSNKEKSKLPLSNTTLLLNITICTFVAMYLIAMIVWGGGFLNPQQFLDIFNNNSYLIVVACGLTIVMITGGIDISVGGTVALITMTSVVCMEDYGGEFKFTFYCFRHRTCNRHYSRYISIIFKFSRLLLLLQECFYKGNDNNCKQSSRTASNEIFLKVKDFYLNIPFIGHRARNGNFIPAYIEIGVIIAVVVVVVLWAMLKWTRFGRNLYAIGGNSESALMLGINVQRTQFFAYVLCGFLAGIGGFIYLLHTGAGNASNATQAEIQAIASSIIGGTLLSGGVGSVIGTLFGVMSLKTINNIVIASGLREPYWQSITTGLMLCFFILLQSIILSSRKRKFGS